MSKKAEKRAEKKGREEGREEGEKQGKKEVALMMLKSGLKINTIKECTGLSEEEIKEVKASLQSR